MQVRAGAYLAILIAACIALLALAPNDASGAAAETRYELIADGLTFGDDLIIAGLNQTVFHQQSAAAGDNEALAITFPGSLDFSPSQGVDIALPAIHQAREDAVSVSSTGFFHANLPFYPCCNFGAAPVGVGQFGKPSPVTDAGFRGNALMYPEMVNQGILTPDLKYENKNLNNTMVTLPPLLASGPYAEVAAVANSTVGETAANNSSLGNVTPPLLLSEQRFNFDSNASQIDNYNIVERMWRNSHLAHLMDVNYEGEASRPVWMTPLKPAEALQLTDHFKVLGYALNLTKPGKYLTKAGWDLEPLTPGKL
ncbi:MAG TPA: hypothetical protein VMC61_07210 [Methanocella sp.]|nr:hypothetical protein [Methanocella sp.]